MLGAMPCCAELKSRLTVASVEAAASFLLDLRACCKDFWMTVSNFIYAELVRNNEVMVDLIS